MISPREWILLAIVGSIILCRGRLATRCPGRFFRRAVLGIVLLLGAWMALRANFRVVHWNPRGAIEAPSVRESVELPEGSVENLPPRAGEIPITAELARTAVAVDESHVEPSPAPAIVAPPVATRVIESAAPPAAATPDPVAPGADAPPSATPAAVATAQSAVARPEWVEAPGKLVGSIYRTSVKSGLYVDVPECQRALDEAIKQAADQYIEDYLGAGASGLVDIPRNYLRAHVAKAEFDEVKASATVGPMHQIHALLEFDDDARADFHHRWREAIVSGRLWRAGSGAAAVLALLATFYGYLKLDLRTGGSHRGRLELAAALVAVVVAAGALVVRWAVPF